MGKVGGGEETYLEPVFQVKGFCGKYFDLILSLYCTMYITVLQIRTFSLVFTLVAFIGMRPISRPIT